MDSLITSMFTSGSGLSSFEEKRNFQTKTSLSFRLGFYCNDKISFEAQVSIWHILDGLFQSCFSCGLFVVIQVLAAVNRSAVTSAKVV